MKEITIEKVLEILNTNIENAEISIGNSDVDLSQLGMDSISFIRVIVSFLLLTEMNTVNKIMNVLNSIEIEPKE